MQQITRKIVFSLHDIGDIYGAGAAGQNEVESGGYSCIHVA